MPAASAAPGLFFAFAAMVLLIFVSVSTPVWQKIYFLEASVASSNVIFGNWGYCISGACSASKLGYAVDSSTLGIPVNYNTGIVHNLTYVFILHPIGAGLAALATIFGCFAVCSTSRGATIMMTLASTLAMLVTLVAFVVDMVLWGIVRNRIRSQGGAAQYGKANWLVLGAFVALILASCVSCVGSFGRFRSNKY